MVTIEGKELQTYDFDEINGKCYGFIYVTRNKLNGTLYLGQHTAWKKNYLGSGILIVKAIKKYGEENFERIIIDVAHNQEKLDDLETMYINEFFGYCIATSKKWYNIKSGSQHGGSCFAGKSEEEMMEIREKLSESLKGKKLSDDHKRKLSEAHKGKKLSDETKHKLSEINKGNHHTEETKKKMRENNIKFWKGKKLSEDHKRKLSESHKGNHHSEETRQKMSENSGKAKKVVLYQTNTNEVLSVYTTRKECTKWVSELLDCNFGSCSNYFTNQLKNRNPKPFKKRPDLNKLRMYYYDDFVQQFGEPIIA
ncbi:NUMOD3 domain-containing DNA-binding protein [Kurthia massiliensis]|uniref:NUMOD3 domain-containing DNA-binding protein n=1 Tax=Kurthia massiliensis TaxID=1033739 RepID=UPI000289C733|nr:NUMOD3 domain-containing DNA-binding protein [Kurthia massiliensis]